MSDGVRSHRIGLLLLAALLIAAPVQAQIVTDGSVGPKVSLQGGQIEIGENLGTRQGDNLFHSFEKFGIATGQTATFTGPNAIRNVISRVTGGEVSRIDGTLASKVGHADFYFLNPAGVMFGPNATLDVPGSFHVSTAHELRFADGARFSALDKTGSGLTVAAPEAFGFLDKPLGRITVDHSDLFSRETLSLVGGDMDINNASLQTVRQVVSLSSAKANTQVRADNGSIAGGQMGTIMITNSHIWGSARIHAGTLSIENSSIYIPPKVSFIDIPQKQGELVDLKADSIEIAKSFVLANGTTPINGRSIIITANNLKLREGATIIRSTYTEDNSGTVIVQARHLSIADQFSGIFNTSESFKLAGQGGKIEILADTIEVRNGGVISTGTSSLGNAGIVDIKTRSLLVSGDGAEVFTGITSSAGSRITVYSLSYPSQPKYEKRFINTPTGAAGEVIIKADTVELHNGGTISSSTATNGNAGTVDVQASRLLISGDSASAFTGITSAAEFGSTGAGGTVTIHARNILLEKGGSVTVASEGSGRGGSLNITAADTLQLNNATLAGRTTADVDVGDAKLEVGRLLHLRDSTVSTEGARGGNMLMQTPLLLLDKSKILSKARPGEGGNIRIEAGQIIRTPDSSIEASGNLTITAPNTDVSGSLTVLPETFFDVSSQLREACAALGGRPASSFTDGGRGSLPPDPSAPLAANSFGQPPEHQTATGSLTPSSRPQQAAKPIMVSGIPQPVLGSPRLTCRG